MSNIFSDLFSRSYHDPGIEKFLCDMFLLMPTILETHQTVCKEWHYFIKSNILEDVKLQRRLLAFLNHRLETGPGDKSCVELSELGLNAWDFNFVNKCVAMQCNDDVAAIDTSTKYEAKLLLVNLRGHGRNIIQLETFEENNRNRMGRLFFKLGKQFLVTGFSLKNKIKLWNMHGEMLTVSIVSTSQIFVTDCKIFSNRIFIMSKENVYILQTSNEVNKKSFRVRNDAILGCNKNLGNVDSIACDPKRPSEFLTSHERAGFALYWNLDQDKKRPLRTIMTGFVVDMVKQENILATIGFEDNPGLKLWNTETGNHIKTIMDGILLSSVKLQGNHLLVSMHTDKSLEKIGTLEDKHFIERETLGEEVHDITPSKLVSLDITNSVLHIKDYWKE